MGPDNIFAYVMRTRKAIPMLGGGTLLEDPSLIGFVVVLYFGGGPVGFPQAKRVPQKRQTHFLGMIVESADLCPGMVPL